MAEHNFILVVENGRRVYKDIAAIKGINAETLNSKPLEYFAPTGPKSDTDIKLPYRVQNDIVLQLIDSPLYVLDGDTLTTTLTLPPVTSIIRGTEVAFLNPTKNRFVINGNGVNFVRSGVQSSTVTLLEYQAIKFIFIDIGQEHTTGLWYELIYIPGIDSGVIATAISDYLVAHPPAGYTHPATHPATMITEDATHKFITDTLLALIHAPGSDNQDLTGLQPKETGKGLSSNDLTVGLKASYDGAVTHAAGAHAPSNAVALATVKADVDVSDAISKKHSNNLDHANTLDHSHSNKSTLDSYTQTEVNLADAVTKRHSNSLDHSNANDHPNTFKCGIATKNITDASTIQNIPHGLGRVPKIVRVTAHCVFAATLSQICNGVYDGTNHSGISICMTEGATTATIDNIYSSATQELGFTALGTTSPFNGANKQSGIITVDATNIIITWTKTGTVASNVVNILWEVS